MTPAIHRRSWVLGRPPSTNHSLVHRPTRDRGIASIGGHAVQNRTEVVCAVVGTTHHCHGPGVRIQAAGPVPADSDTTVVARLPRILETVLF